ncbi:hypothetical protein AXG93_522s1030 [Marchantia polymorpha subsp. ruderalis]|uniref:Uncharacterized protein n=1 Tax=Marchantia polymorpha subsp. ruderalis TaxID=1480154 RepID=A0A176VVW3_MARPO|nr:hypothetical protein AXG93_522s1030 [Marchantia polymorpha subsp. ruderalis]
MGTPSKEARIPTAKRDSVAEMKMEASLKGLFLGLHHRRIRTRQQRPYTKRETKSGFLSSCGAFDGEEEESEKEKEEEAHKWQGQPRGSSSPS